MGQAENPGINTSIHTDNSEGSKEADNRTIIEVLVTEDGITGYIKLVKQPGENIETTKELMMEALQLNHIVFGIKEEIIEKLSVRPLYNIKIEVAKGTNPLNGVDGTVNFFVENDMEYKPEFNTEGVVDYKNLDYFQLVKKDQILCGIIKETLGTDGRNIYGGVLPGRTGRAPSYPTGKNTHLIESETLLVASCDGVVHFVRGIIDINDLLKISTNVGQHTGNVNFTGDVTIDGDVCNSFSVKAGGNVIVKGVVEDSTIEAGGNLHISKGISGTSKNTITVMGDLRCHYIENAILYVEGNISADYIIDSKVTCLGNIELSGGNELVLGGEIKVKGELKVKEIGSEKGRTTTIEVIGLKIIDNQLLDKLHMERELYNSKAIELLDKARKLAQLIELENNADFHIQLALVKKQMLLIRERIGSVTYKIQETENNWRMEYTGSVVCKRKLYQGSRIFFGDERFHFSFDNVEHCRIYYNDGEIVQGIL